MNKKEDQNKSSSRRDFLKYATAGVLGTAMGGMVWPDKANSRQNSAVIERIAFGSCADQSKPQSIWDAIVDRNPDVFLGDNIYGDTEDMSVLEKKYGMLASKPGYQHLLETCPILSTWDDHDYGKNDAGSEYSMKKESEQIFMGSFDIPQDSPRRQRPGVYRSYISGPLGKRLQIILLDTRYFKDTSGRKGNAMSEEEKKKKILLACIFHRIILLRLLLAKNSGSG